MINKDYYKINDENYLDLTIKVNKIFSENTYLNASTKMKRIKGKLIRVNYLYKRSDVRDYQSRIERQLLKNYNDAIINFSNEFSSDKFLTIFEYNLNTSINRRDLSNMKKLLEDSITNVIKKVLKDSKSTYKFDDSQIYETREIKIPTEGEKEFINIRIYPIIG